MNFTPSLSASRNADIKAPRAETHPASVLLNPPFQPGNSPVRTPSGIVARKASGVSSHSKSAFWSRISRLVSLFYPIGGVGTDYVALVMVVWGEDWIGEPAFGG